MSDAFSGAMNALMNLSQQIQNVAGVASGAKIGYTQQKKLMALQNQYNIDAFERSNARQDEILQTSPMLAVQGLKNAGLSPSDPTGQGYQSSPSAMQQDSPTAPSASIPIIPSVDYVGSYAALAQAENINSQTRLNDIEASYRAKKLAGEVGRLNLEIDQAREKFPLLLDSIRQDLDNKVEQKSLTRAQADKVIQETENLKAVLDGISLDNKFNAETLSQRKQKLSAEVAGLLKDNRIKEAQAVLADSGIIVGQDGLTMLFSALMNGKGSEVLDQLTDAFGDMIKELPAAVGSLLVDVVDAVSGAPKRIWNKVKKKVTGD